MNLNNLTIKKKKKKRKNKFDYLHKLKEECNLVISVVKGPLTSSNKALIKNRSSNIFKCTLAFAFYLVFGYPTAKFGNYEAAASLTQCFTQCFIHV